MVTAQLATIPERVEILPLVIDSLIKQVDQLNIMCNNYSGEQLIKLREYCKKLLRGEMLQDRPRRAIIGENQFILLTRRDNQKSDGEKHYKIEDIPAGYIFTCDDDILYPPDYVQKTIEKIEYYNRKYVVTYHGRVWNELPIYSFYRDRAEMYQCLNEVTGDHIILNDSKQGCGGDGVMAWHVDTFKMRYELCELPNMSQLWVALACNKQGVPQIVLEHKEGWLQYLLDEGYETIWDKHNNEDAVQTQLINERWIIR